MNRRLAHFALLAAILTPLASSVSATAQMITGERMKNFGEAFDVKVDQRSYPFNAVLVQTDIPGNVLWPGDQPTWTIQLQNNGPAAIKAKGKFDIIHYGTRGISGDVWTPDVLNLGVVTSVPFDVDLAGKGFQNVTIHPTLPDTFGGYAVVADLGTTGRRFVLSCVRTFKPTPEKIQYPSLSLDDIGLETLRRLGVQALRVGANWVAPDDKDYDKKMADLDKQLKAYQDNNITVMLMMGPGDVPQALGRPRPHLDEQNVMLDTKSDLAWLPSSDDDFQKWVTQVASKYGWPKGPVTAISLWNEPWEGISISGWGADMPRFREIYTHMAKGIEQARKDANVDVLIAGCDSSTNTIDKLFPNGSTEFLKWLDACTIHYQGMTSPAMYKMWLNRQAPSGRVKIWDTESWVANVDDRVAAVVATNKSAGYDRAMGVFGGNLADHTPVDVMTEDGKTVKTPQQTAWSTSASVGAAVHFIGERKFKELLFKNGLPWVMLFDPEKKTDGSVDAEDGTIVIIGDIGEEFDKDNLLFRTIYGLKQVDARNELAKKVAALPATTKSADRAPMEKELKRLSIIADSTLLFDDGGGKFKLYDFYGNPVASLGGKITVPLDGRGFFLRADGSPGSFDAMTNAVRGAHVDGFECLEMLPHDMIAPVESKPTLRITCTNVFNRPITGTLTAKLGDLTLETLPQLRFAAGETRDIELKIAGGNAVPSNSYPLILRFDAGTDGFSEYAEDVHVNLIAHRTINIDGKLDDWKGVLPQTIASSGSAGPTMQEAAWFPFAKYDASVQKGMSSGYLAYDENYFYFAAKVADATPDGGTMRFETRDDDQFYYPDVAYELDPAKTFATKPGMISTDLRKPFALLKPDGSGDRSYDTLESAAKAFKINVSIPQGEQKQITFYFLDNDSYENGRRKEFIHIADAKTGKQLDGRPVQQFGRGTYAVYEISGDVVFTITNLTFLNASIAGVFIDDTANAKASGTSARFVKFDETTEGNWKSAYGKLGSQVIGSAAKYPAGVTVEFPQIIDKKEYNWPAGVRHYSYRRRPILPSGSAPNFDNVQIAFNSIPLEDDPIMTPNPPGTMPKYCGYRDTDYQFALNKVADKFGGGTEIWRLDEPDQMRKNFFPRQPNGTWEGAVKNGKLVVTQDGGTRIVECAMPWSEIPHVKELLDSGRTVKFSFRVNDDAGVGCMELARGRAVSRKNSLAFSPDWIEHWANEVEFGFEKSPAPTAP